MSREAPAGRRATDRVVDAACAASVAGWAVAAFLRSAPADRASPVLWALVALHATVAAAFLRRSRARREASRGTLLACVPSIVSACVAWRVAPEPSAWPAAAAAVFVLGAALACGALLCLGRSFAVLPAVRRVVSRGPYRVVRHPAYAGELLMVAAGVAAAGDARLALGLVPVTAALLALRIVAEERHLSSEPDYRAYAERVRHRLVPFVW